MDVGRVFIQAPQCRNCGASGRSAGGTFSVLEQYDKHSAMISFSYGKRQQMSKHTWECFLVAFGAL